MMKMVLGVPGAGKTHYLLEILRPRIGKCKCLFLTFTRAAAKEARDRLAEEKEEISHTIHSLCAKFIGLTKKQVPLKRHYNEVLDSVGLPKIFSTTGNTLGNSFISNTTGEDYKEDQDLFNAAWEEYKKANYLKDFNDILKQGLEEIRELPKDKILVHTLCVDECQDLSSLQWDIVLELAARSKEVYFAGDDDQCIFRYAGADVNKMLEVSNSCKIVRLQKSRRVPERAAEKANSLISGVEKRIPKQIVSTGNLGKVYEFDEEDFYRLSYLLERSENFLYLCRTNYLASVKEKEIMAKCPELLKKGEVTTIHRAKGREADTVVLYTRPTTKIWLWGDADDEARLWYVGLTRTKKTLILLNSRKGKYNL